MWLVGLLGLLPMTFSVEDTTLGPWTTPWWVSAVGLIILATVLAYVSGIMAARSLGSKVASFVSLTEVLFAVIWAWLLLGGNSPAPFSCWAASSLWAAWSWSGSMSCGGEIAGRPLLPKKRPAFLITRTTWNPSPPDMSPRRPAAKPRNSRVCSKSLPYNGGTGEQHREPCP